MIKESKGKKRGKIISCHLSKCLFPSAKLKKYKMVSVFTSPDVNTREVGRTRDKRRKPRREVDWFPAYRVFSQPPKCLHQAI